MPKTQIELQKATLKRTAHFCFSLRRTTTNQSELPYALDRKLPNMKKRFFLATAGASRVAVRTLSAVVAFGLFALAPAARAQCTAPPTVTFNPSDVTAFPGEQVSFFAEGSSSAGCPVTYAWYERISGVPTYITGATNQTLTVTTPSYPGDPNRDLFGC